MLSWRFRCQLALPSDVACYCDHLPFSRWVTDGQAGRYCQESGNPEPLWTSCADKTGTITADEVVLERHLNILGEVCVAAIRIN